MDLGKLTLHDILESILKEKTDEVLLKIQDAIKAGKQGEELKAVIYHALCEANVTDVGIFAICDTLPRIPHVITSGPKI